MFLHAYAIVGGLATGAAVTGTLGTARPPGPTICTIPTSPGPAGAIRANSPALETGGSPAAQARGSAALDTLTPRAVEVRASEPASGGTKDQGGLLPRSSAAIALPASAGSRRVDEPSVSSISVNSAIGERSTSDLRAGSGSAPAAGTLLRADAVRRAGQSTFSFAVPRSPIFGVPRRNHLVAFGEFPPVASPPCARAALPTSAGQPPVATPPSATVTPPRPGR